MNKLILFTIAFGFTACATLAPKDEELQQAPMCQVWQEGILGNKNVVSMEGETAKKRITCWVFNSFLCSYDEYSLKPGTSEVHSEIFGDRPLAKLNGNVMHMNMPGVSVEPFELKDRDATYQAQGPIGPKQDITVKYNDKCSKRQVAIGLTVLMGT